MKVKEMLDYFFVLLHAIHLMWWSAVVAELFRCAAAIKCLKGFVLEHNFTNPSSR